MRWIFCTFVVYCLNSQVVFVYVLVKNVCHLLEKCLLLASYVQANDRVISLSIGTRNCSPK